MEWHAAASTGTIHIGRASVLHDPTQEQQMRHLTTVVLCGALLLSSATSLTVLAADAPQANKPAAQTAGTSTKPAAKPAAGSATATPSAPAAKASGSAGDLYKVEGGTKVDAKTLAGWKTWRALACERCHGAEQEGLVGPPLTESMKKLTKEEFHSTLMKGRLEKGMPPFNTSKMVTDNWEGLYAYLMGRSDGKIKAGRLTGIEGK
jgi:mono/diheme cytochrome c family protein